MNCPNCNSVIEDLDAVDPTTLTGNTQCQSCLKQLEFTFEITSVKVV